MPYPTETISLKCSELAQKAKAETNKFFDGGQGEVRHYHYYFWFFILIHTLLWTLGPSLLRPTVSHDTLEGITWGLQWQLGYSKHPFLTAWLCAGVTKLFGGVGWPVYLLAQLAVSLTFIAVWKLAQQILPLGHALIATLALEGVLFYNINSFNFTPDTLQSPLWALLSLFFYQALTKQNVMNWLCTALFAALCVCTKYQVALLFLPMFLFCLLNPLARKSFTKPGIYYALGTFFLLIIPHLIWLYQHHFITLTYASEISSDYTQNKMPLNHFRHPFGFVINSIMDVAGLFILLWPFYNKNKIQLPLESFQWQFLIFLGLGPLTLSLILCLFTGDYFPPRWSTPYFFALGILAIAYLKPALSKKNLKQFVTTLILFSSILFLARMSTLTFIPRSNSDAFLPNHQIALSLSKLWREQYHTPLPFLAGSNYLVTGVTPYMTDNPVPYLNWKSEDSPWINEKELRQQGGLFIWDESGYYTWDKESRAHTKLPESVLERFPKLRKIPNYIFYRLSDKQPVTIGVAILPPDPDCR
ncbi:glycosyltransferase family 39 protein [Legionella maioricensis]|uniref:Glycosyltransferase family 39 protein n=1 Tax=Legionella maioricensis TaxID=2896528 RepID=A0A9X2D5A7_9GAMM|nr:glycosyltransferase family 39 protein [Legionella maioricensis]MCL9685767.1 glycosyltransferase family 39 protein [Legionella maioricensis]MCL9689174.1 glycosyltransferase family 39 protein [Legionella maioricensis]